MNPTIKGSGFGSFSRILGPWSDFFPSDKTQPLSHVGLGLGTEIIGGVRGATITSITISPPGNVAGTLAPIPFRLLVFRGRIPNDIEQMQLSVSGLPKFGADQLVGIQTLFEYVLSANQAANSSQVVDQQQLHFPFPNGGPNVGPGEYMSVLLTMMNNETGVPGYGGNNQTFASISVMGIYDRGVGGDQIGGQGRSIPRGRISGI